MIFMRENETGPGSAPTLSRPLTRLLDLSERGLAVKATRTWPPRSCDVCSTVFLPSYVQQLRCGKTCSAEAVRIYQAARVRHFEPDVIRRQRMRKHGITPERYAELLQSQDGGCAVCGGLNRGRHLEIDHDHACCPGVQSCGQCVRGLLCGPCNKALGQLKDDAALLRRAAEYLEARRVGL